MIVAIAEPGYDVIAAQCTQQQSQAYKPGPQEPRIHDLVGVSFATTVYALGKLNKNTDCVIVRYITHGIL